MSSIQIPYSKRQRNFHLSFSIIWLVFFLLRLVFAEDNHWINYGWLLFSLVYFGIYIYQKKYSYLSVQNGTLRVNGPLGQQLKLSEIQQVKKFAGDFTVKTYDKQVAFSTQNIQPEVLSKLLKELEQQQTKEE